MSSSKVKYDSPHSVANPKSVTNSTSNCNRSDRSLSSTSTTTTTTTTPTTPLDSLSSDMTNTTKTTTTTTTATMTTTVMLLASLLVLVVAIVALAIMKTSPSESLISLVVNLATFFQAGFFLFSLFTWFHLIASRLKISSTYLDDHLIYSAFLFAFVSEFVVQFVVFNCWTTSTSTSTSTSSSSSTSSFSSSSSPLTPAAATNLPQISHHLESVLFLLTFVCLSTLSLALLEQTAERFRIHLRVILIATLTRIYGSVSFGNVLPQSTCSYCAYISAFAGLMFSHYINFIIESMSTGLSNSNKSSTITSTTTMDIYGLPWVVSNLRRPMDERFLVVNNNISNEKFRRGDDDNNDNNNQAAQHFHHHQNKFDYLGEQEMRPQKSQKRSQAKSNLASSSSSSSSSTFRRRTSLPTIPFKFDKSSNLDHSAIMREIKSKIDDLMSEASNSTSEEPMAPVLDRTLHQHHQQLATNRLLKGLRTIRNLINRSSLNQIIIDRQFRLHQEQQQKSSTTTTTTTTTQAAVQPVSSNIREQHFDIPSKKSIDRQQSDLEVDETFRGNSNSSRRLSGNDTAADYEEDEENDEDEGDECRGRVIEANDDGSSRIQRRHNSLSADEENETRGNEAVAVELIRKQTSQVHRNRKSLPTHFYRRIFATENSKRLNQNGDLNNFNQTSGKFFNNQALCTEAITYPQQQTSPYTVVPNVCQEASMDASSSSAFSKPTATTSPKLAKEAVVPSNHDLISQQTRFSTSDYECKKSDSPSATESDNLTAINNQIQSICSKTSDYESGESPTNSDSNSDTDKLQVRPQNYFETTAIKNAIQHHDMISQKRLEQIKEEYMQKSKAKVSYRSTLGTITQIIMASAKDEHAENDNVSQPVVWTHPDDLEKNSDLLNCLHDWNFPIFRFGQKAQKFILSQMACKIFEEIGLFKSFDIPMDKFINYFTALESGYMDLPYHNRIHAADVLHACYYFTTQAVPNCSNVNKYISELHMQSSQSRSRPRLNPHQYSLKYCLRSQSSDEHDENEGYGCLGDNFTQLEILALYCSAAMHDYEHPGRNNAFLIRINSPLALLYNDRSILENHHASASWLLLKSNEDFNFLSNLDSQEWTRLRYLVIENILATDLSRHFAILNHFNSKFNKSRSLESCKENGILSTRWDEDLIYDFPEKSSPIDWKSEQDRLLVSQMVLKLADINAPLKKKELHIQWTARIVEEFYQQGDEEASLGLTMSPYMDRNNPQVAKLQENFISVLVGSLLDSFTYAGLLPGTIVKEEKEENNDSNQTNSNKRFQSEMISNIKSNYVMWCARMKQEEENQD